MNPKTGLCRVGSFCVAAGNDPWAVTVTLDSPACVDRTPEPCASTAGSPQQLVEGEVIRRIWPCNFPPDAFLRVEVGGGCPVLFNLDFPAGEKLVSCLTEALSWRRWSCAGASECVLYAYDTL